MEVYVSTHLDKYRKPSVYFWRKFEERLKARTGQSIDYESSFYCGDCAGRRMNPTSKSPDLKDSDYKFALNIGIKFFTPEELFVKETAVSGRRQCAGGELPDYSEYTLMMEGLKSSLDPLKVL